MLTGANRFVELSGQSINRKASMSIINAIVMLLIVTAVVAWAVAGFLKDFRDLEDNDKEENEDF